MQSLCKIAVILHLISKLVNGPSPRARSRQIERTEERILGAAHRLFLQRGYATTTLVDVAEAAKVGERTVYVRFGTKAALFKRVVDVAIVGDTLPIDVMGRDWASHALHAPTAFERCDAAAHNGRMIMERTGKLFAVAQQAAAIEPVIAGFWEEGRAGSRHVQEVLWTTMDDDGLLHPQCDLRWIIDTAVVLANAEGYLLAVRMHGWDLDRYEQWLRTSFRQRAVSSAAA
jgi:AcrR family transcriptional regulator